MRTSKILLFLSISFISYAGTVDSNLQEKLNGMNPEDTVEVIISMADKVDIFALDQQLRSEGADRQKRHYEVVTALRDKAEYTQIDLLGYLDTRKKSKKVYKYKSYWIDNLVYTRCQVQEVYTIADRSDVDVIFENFEIHLIEPVESQSSIPRQNSAEPGLKAINAHKLWAQGITGNGVLLCNIDTGVHYPHNSLTGKWRGNKPDVLPEQAWFVAEGLPQSTYPYDDNNHGTHTMGIMCGLAPETNDTIGVAFGAEWIAAKAFNANGGGLFNSIVQCLEWAIDPDGDPETTDDVPNVISNSWGSSPDVFPVEEIEPFKNLLINIEASGIIPVFSAGNSGPAYNSIEIPAAFAYNTLNILAVGALNGNDPEYPCAGFSSRGPSDYVDQGDNPAFKPDVSAPGVLVRSSVNPENSNGDFYQYYSGTSMSAPHVAGLIGLLCQNNEDVYPQEYKNVVKYSSTDLGDPGLDNGPSRVIAPHYIKNILSL